MDADQRREEECNGDSLWLNIQVQNVSYAGER